MPILSLVSRFPLRSMRCSQGSPLRSQRNNAKLADDPSGGQAHNRRKCWVGQLHLGQLLYPHVSRHSSRHDLHDL